MSLSKAQEQIVKTTANKVVVVAAAASGKTATLVARTKYLLDGGADPTRVVVITFTNAAAEEIAERLGRPRGLFVGTIHSYANYLLLSNGKDTQDLLENEQFDRLFSRIKKNPECIRAVDHLLLDESQDSNEAHFEFLLDIVKPKNYMLMGDWRQSIYRFNGAYPDYLVSLAENPQITTYSLDENYRNGSNILTFAKNIISVAGYDYRDTSIPMRGVAGKVLSDIEYSPVAIARTIRDYGHYGEWFVLTRTNAQLDEMAYHLTKEGVPNDTFKRSELDNKELAAKMSQDTVKVLTIHTSKGLEANNVIVIGAKFFNIEERCVSYVAATRARNLLVWTKQPNRRRSNAGISNWEN